MPSSDVTAVGGPAVIVPVKSFAEAKDRLRPALSASEREALARRLAEGVVRAAAPLPVWVACDDPEVARWARRLGAAVAWTPGLGLNGAVGAAADLVRSCGASELVVAHGDLALPAALSSLAGFEGITLVPDRGDDGTNVVCLPARAPFAFSYGPGSFRRHVQAARHSGLDLRIVRSDELAWDIDVPADLHDLATHIEAIGG